jgi:hypothetical protein
MNGPDGHLGNENDGPRIAGLRALAVRGRLPALATLFALLLVLALSQSSPADSGGRARAAAHMAAGSADALSVSLEPENPEATLLAPEGALGIHERKFGSSVALSGNGSTALIGAPNEDDGPEQDEGPGSAWVVTRANGKWNTNATELAMPAADSAPGACGSETPEEGVIEEDKEEAAHACRFGISVALSQSGETAVIGAPHAHGNSGAVFIFTRSGSTWSMTAELTNPNPEVESRFGQSVAVSAAGATVLVGAPMYRGWAWVFTDSGAGWAETAELANPARTESAGPGAGMFSAAREGAEEGKGLFGQSVALSADGQTALVGAPGYPGQKGAAWVVHDLGPSATYTRLEVSGGTGRADEAEAEKEARFGAGVALSGDGGTALVGAPGFEGAKGAAWVFAGAEAWAEKATFTGVYATAEEAEEVGKEERFGRSVALSYDGNTALAGATFNDEREGAVWRFGRTPGVAWSEQRRLQPEDTEHSRVVRFGTGVALSFNAETALVGGRGAEHVGQAWIFGPNPAVYGVKPSNGPVTGGTTVTIRGEHLSEATAVRFGAAEATDVNVAPSGRSLTAVTPPGVEAGTVQVSVETPIGTSEDLPADRFTYVAKGTGGGGGGGGGANGKGKEEAVSQSGSTDPTPKSGVLPFGPFAGGACGAVPAGKRFSVNSHSRALVKLRGAGAGKCAGKLTLRVKVAQAVTIGKKKAFKLRAIGTANFAIVAGQTRVLAIKLNAAGRLLLKAGRGRLNTSLLIVKSSPTPVQARAASVRLTQLKTKPGVKKA